MWYSYFCSRISESRLAPAMPLLIGSRGRGAMSTEGMPSGGSMVLSRRPHFSRMISLTRSCPGLCSTMRVISSPIFLYSV